MSIGVTVAYKFISLMFRLLVFLFLLCLAHCGTWQIVSKYKQRSFNEFLETDGRCRPMSQAERSALLRYLGRDGCSGYEEVPQDVDCDRHGRFLVYCVREKE